MKKFLAVLFSALFAFSCLSVMAFAADEKTTEVNVSVVVPTTVECPYCHMTVSANTLTEHYKTCEGYAQYKIDEATNTCYWCGKKFTNEAAFNQHMTDYVAAKDHIAHCPYSGEDYVDGGCDCTFKTNKEYNKHLEICVHKGDYTTMGKIKYYLNLIKDTLVTALKNINWSKVLEGVKTLFGGLTAGVKIST